LAVAGKKLLARGLHVSPPAMPSALLPLHEAVSAFKRQLIIDTLSSFNGNRSRAAAALGIERTSLLRLIRDLELEAVPRGQRGRPARSEERPHPFSKTCRRCHIDALRSKVLESLAAAGKLDEEESAIDSRLGAPATPRPLPVPHAPPRR
jgi:hypothetical protein